MVHLLLCALTQGCEGCRSKSALFSGHADCWLAERPASSRRLRDELAFSQSGSPELSAPTLSVPINPLPHLTCTFRSVPGPKQKEPCDTAAWGGYFALGSECDRVVSVTPSEWKVIAVHYQVLCTACVSCLYLLSIPHPLLLHPPLSGGQFSFFSFLYCLNCLGSMLFYGVVFSANLCRYVLCFRKVIIK